MEALVGNTIERIRADKGYRGHNAPPDYKFRVFTPGQKRRTTPKIKRELRRRSAVEPSSAISSPSIDWVATTSGIAKAMPPNAVLAAVGYNFRHLIRWLRLLWTQIIASLAARLQLIPG